MALLALPEAAWGLARVRLPEPERAPLVVRTWVLPGQQLVQAQERVLRVLPEQPGQAPVLRVVQVLPVLARQELPVLPELRVRMPLAPLEREQALPE